MEANETLGRVAKNDRLIACTSFFGADAENSLVCEAKIDSQDAAFCEPDSAIDDLRCLWNRRVLTGTRFFFWAYY